jgi:hypothetical protein
MSTGKRAIHPKRRSERLASVELDGEIVIYDEEDNSIHHLNPTASLVWKSCDGTSTVRELAIDFAEAFDVPEPKMERDLRQIIRQMADSKLMETPRPRARSDKGRR